MKILTVGYEDVVRSRFGIDSDDLTNEEINLPLIVNLAEGTLIKRVPDYANITDEIEILYLQNAVISQICYLLCPSMAKRLNMKLSISDVKLEKEKVDWDAVAHRFLSDVELNLNNITTVLVTTGIQTGSSVLVDKVRNKRDPIGGDFYG